MKKKKTKKEKAKKVKKAKRKVIKITTAMTISKGTNLISRESALLVAALFDHEDTELIAAEHAGRYVKKLGYALVNSKTGKPYLDEDGNPVEALSMIGIRECARASYRFKFGEPKETYLEDKKRWVVRTECTNLDTGENAWGGAEVDEQWDTGKINKFAYASAISKSQRNAQKKLNKLEDELKWFAVWKRQGLIAKIPYDRQKALIEVGGDRAEVEKMVKACFVRCAEIGVDKDLWHDAAKIIAGVDSIFDVSLDWIKEREHTIATIKGDKRAIEKFKLHLIQNRDKKK